MQQYGKVIAGACRIICFCYIGLRKVLFEVMGVFVNVSKKLDADAQSATA